MKPKRPPRLSPQVQKAACTKRIPKLNPAYYGNIACLIRLYLRICRNPYLHLPRVRANRAAWGFVERWRGHFYLDLGLDLPVGQSEWYCVFRACLLPGSLQQGDEEAEEHFDDILKAMSMMFYLPAYALAQPQSTVCNKTVLLPKAARRKTTNNAPNCCKNCFSTAISPMRAAGWCRTAASCISCWTRAAPPNAAPCAR